MLGPSLFSRCVLASGVWCHQQSAVTQRASAVTICLSGPPFLGKSVGMVAGRNAVLYLGCTDSDTPNWELSVSLYLFNLAPHCSTRSFVMVVVRVVFPGIPCGQCYSHSHGVCHAQRSSGPSGTTAMRSG